MNDPQKVTNYDKYMVAPLREQMLQRIAYNAGDHPSLGFIDGFMAVDGAVDNSIGYISYTGDIDKPTLAAPAFFVAVDDSDRSNGLQYAYVQPTGKFRDDPVMLSFTGRDSKGVVEQTTLDSKDLGKFGAYQVAAYQPSAILQSCSPEVIERYNTLIQDDKDVNVTELAKLISFSPYTVSVGEFIKSLVSSRGYADTVNMLMCNYVICNYLSTLVAELNQGTQLKQNKTDFLALLPTTPLHDYSQFLYVIHSAVGIDQEATPFNENSYADSDELTKFVREVSALDMINHCI